MTASKPGKDVTIAQWASLIGGLVAVLGVIFGFRWWGEYQAEQPIVPTGDWYIMHRGPHAKWCVITPTGVVRTQGINTEAEARNLCSQESRNPRPR